MVDTFRDKALQKTLRRLENPGEGGGARWPWVLALFVVCVALVFVAAYWGLDSPTLGSREEAPTQKSASAPDRTGAQSPAKPAGEEGPPSAPGKVVSLSPGEKATASADKQSVTGTVPSPDSKSASPADQSQLQVRRKKPYGLDKSLDAVVLSDESIKVGDKVVPMAELERKLVVKHRGDVLEKPLDQKGKPKVSAWGVYLVRPGENLWGIHFILLQEYMRTRGVELSRDADQPTPQGFSSGVGKVLKFAEHMVGVYNLKTGEMTKDLNVLEPGNKVVVYNLTEIFGQLAKIDPQDLSGVMYDGRVLLFPKKSQAPAGGQAKDKKS